MFVTRFALGSSIKTLVPGSARLYGTWPHSFLSEEQKSLLNNLEEKIKKPLTPKESRVQFFGLLRKHLSLKDTIPTSLINVENEDQKFTINLPPQEQELARALFKASDLFVPIGKFVLENANKPEPAGGLGSKSQYANKFYRLMTEVKIPLFEEVQSIFDKASSKTDIDRILVDSGILDAATLQELDSVIAPRNLVQTYKEIASLKIFKSNPEQATAPSVSDALKSFKDELEAKRVELLKDLEKHDNQLTTKAASLGIDRSEDSKRRRLRWNQLFQADPNIDYQIKNFPLPSFPAVPSASH